MLDFGGVSLPGFLNVGAVGFFWFLQLILQIVLSTWAYRDAIQRGNSKEFSIIVMVGVLLVPLAGAIVYFLIREDRNDKPII